MTVTKEFLEFAQDCPYCEGDPSAGACCSYYGEQAFTCRLENCPLVKFRCPLSERLVDPEIDCLPNFCDVALHGCEPVPVVSQQCLAFKAKTHHCEAFAAECPSGGDSDSPDCYLNKLT